ncbi:hypothetical protein KQ910_07100 [Reyranella sp. MMS21-HV4-11]|uniref:Uncharacterized protein n=1 Tax=Reyranella humidisoli TaxID=2849149 RepID=A0ABS6IJV6_9HYPH|nr:hypothetical protein [Reyranella sp. MMS21-HV4-11]MBU8873525.1 hypothetical protein [Reyranella sp. MMS21-HV4-11]
MTERGRETGHFAHGLAVPAARGLNAPPISLVRVDHATRKRTPRLSPDFFREVIARNASA